MVIMTPDELPKTIMLVDDDEEIRHVLRLLFEFEGFDVVAEANDGPEATVLALRHQPAFVILDQNMPKMTGEKTAEILRSTSPDSRIVAFSAILDEKPLWADAFLNKNRISEVLPLLASLLKEEPVASPG
jgi:CheY-like chemotaxis protein